MSTSAFFEMGVGMCQMPENVAASQGKKEDEFWSWEHPPL